MKVINAIGESENVHFSNIRQTIEKENLPNFVKILLNEKSDLEEINNIISNSSSSTEKIYDVIKYLGETRNPNEPLFKVLRYNFDEQKFALSSSVTFYTNFLNTYFLKENNDKLLERCSTIIFGNIKL